MEEGIYFCEHCNRLIESLNDARNHKCFHRKEQLLYQRQTDNIIIVDNNDNENKDSDEGQAFNNEDFQNSSSSGNTANVKNPDISNRQDFKTESNAKKYAVWTNKAIMAMLSLYEAKIQILNDIGKQSQVWKQISEGLKDLCIQITADQVKWKFNRLNSKYKECIDNNSKSGRAHMTFEYYEQYEEIFHKEKNVSTPRTLSSSIFATNEKKRKHEVTEKIKLDVTSGEKNLPSGNESLQHKKSPVAYVKKNPKYQQHFQSLEVLQQIQENQKCRNEKMTKYLKMKEEEMELKKKAVDTRELETQVKRDVAYDKLKLNEKRHKDWLNIEKIKCELLKKLLKNHEESD